MVEGPESNCTHSLPRDRIVESLIGKQTVDEASEVTSVSPTAQACFESVFFWVPLEGTSPDRKSVV